MAIAVTCECGRALRLKDELAGKKVRCPDCSATVVVPQPEPDEAAFEVLAADDPADAAPPSPIRESLSERPRRPPPPPMDDDDPPPRKKIKVPGMSGYDPDPPPRRMPTVVAEEGWFGSINSGMIGGIIMILIAVVWFVGGMAAGIIFFYPPILLVIGIIAFLKGLFSRD